MTFEWLVAVGYALITGHVLYLRAHLIAPVRPLFAFGGFVWSFVTIWTLMVATSMATIQPDALRALYVANHLLIQSIVWVAIYVMWLRWRLDSSRSMYPQVQKIWEALRDD